MRVADLRRMPNNTQPNSPSSIIIALSRWPFVCDISALRIWKGRTPISAHDLITAELKRLRGECVSSGCLKSREPFWSVIRSPSAVSQVSYPLPSALTAGPEGGPCAFGPKDTERLCQARLVCPSPSQVQPHG